MYHGNIRLESTIDIKFTTRRFSTGAPFTLAGTPAVSAYIGNSTTQITAGITLTVDFDAVTGLNNVRVEATAANGYTANTNVQLVITAGTVDSVSVVGEVIGSFSIDARPVTLADGVSHGGTLGSSTATLALSRTSIVSQSSNTAALTVTGNGTGNGATIASGSGASGDGLAVSSAATNGAGFRVAGSGTGSGFVTTGGSGGNAHGILSSGGSGGGSAWRLNTTDGAAITMRPAGAGGHGFDIATVDGHGFLVTAASVPTTARFGINVNGAGSAGSDIGDGIRAIGAQAGNGLRLSASGTGNGLRILGGTSSGAGVNITATSGDGITATGGTNGNGMTLTGAGSGVDLSADITGNITGNLSGSVGSVAAGGITAASIATDAIDADAIAASAVTEIQSGLSTLNAAAVSAAVWDAATASYGAAGSYGLLVETNLDAAVSSRLSTAGYTAPDNASITTILSDTNDIQTRLPAALVGGRMDASVGAVAANAITAAGIAADVTTELRALASGTSDSGTTTTMVDAARTEADTDYWKGAYILFTSGTIAGQCRLITGFTPGTDTITFAPATTQAVGTQTYEILPSARVDVNSWLGTTAATPSVAGVPEVDLTHVNGAATTATLDTIKAETASIQSDTNDIQTRLPAALVSGRMDASVGAMAANVMTAAATAADYVTELQSGLSTLNAAAVSAAVWDAATASYGAAGSYGLLVETNLDAAVSSRLSTAGYTAPDNASIAAILVDTGTTLQGELDGIQATVDAILLDTAEIGVAGAGLTNINLPDQTMNITGDITGNLSGSVGSVTAGVTLANAVTHGGATAVLQLQSVSVSNSAGNAVTLASTGANGHGLATSGNGNGSGLIATGGAMGIGIQGVGGSSSGNAMDLTATDGHGLRSAGAGSAKWGFAVSSASADAARFTAGGASSHGIRAVGGATSGDGFRGEGGGSGSGFDGLGGITGHGAAFFGGVTSGDGLHVEARGIGDGLEALGAGGGYDINADIQGSVSGSVGSVTGLTVANLDVAVSTRLATAGYTAPDNASISAILTDTNELQTDWVDGGRLDLILDARASQASVDDLPTNAELATALDPLPTAAENATAVGNLTLTELAAIPGASPALKDALALLYMALRNQRATTATSDVITNDAGATIATATLSDDTVTFTKSEYV